MRPLAATLALAAAACAPFVRSDPGPADAGTPSFSVLDINGFLVPPGTPIDIGPAPVATSPKFFVRKPSGSEPDCYYGVFVAERSAAGQPNNGVLLTALGDMGKINNDPNLGGATRTSCPPADAYTAGGAIPDGIKPGDTLQVTGYFEPYCDYVSSASGGCQYPLFPEVTPDPPDGQSEGSVSDTGPGTPMAPLVVDPSEISDLAPEAEQYAGELLQVQNVSVNDQPLDPYGDVVLDQGSLWVTALSTSFALPEAAGTQFCSITGNLHFQFGHWKLRPRTASDIVICDPDAGVSCCSGACVAGACSGS